VQRAEWQVKVAVRKGEDGGSEEGKGVAPGGGNRNASGRGSNSRQNKRRAQFDLGLSRCSLSLLRGRMIDVHSQFD
jgi:hypothetical protein